MRLFELSDDLEKLDVFKMFEIFPPPEDGGKIGLTISTNKR